MIRPILTELLLFAAPFIAYAVLLWATRAGVLHPDSWPLRTVIGLTAVALLLSAQANADTLAALEMTDDAIFTEDADGNVQYANRAARQGVVPLNGHAGR